MLRRVRTVRRTVTAVLVALVFVFPFLVMLSTALKPDGEIFSSPPTLLPRSWTLENFRAALDAIPFWRYLGNTLLIAALSVIGTCLSCPLVAYSLAKVRWRGSRIVFMAIVGTMVLPPQVTMIPLYLIWDKAHAVGTILPLVVPSFLGVPFFIFLIRQFLVSVSDSLIEAGRIDGASEFRVYWSIVLPIARPAVVTAAVFQFMWAWTDFVGPLIYLNRPEARTLSIGLYSFFGENTVAWGPLMAASVMFTLPAVIIFVIGQRFFIGGISAGAIK
jgi:multiple sugar transport system permease protein